MYDCLQNLIGITKSDCNCTVDGLSDTDLDEGLPEGEHWYNQSTSELYLDELEGIVPLKAINDSTECVSEMAKWYYNAREQAIKFLGDDVRVAITQRLANSKKAYIGKIASTKFSGTQLLSTTYGGLKLATAQMKGGTIKIDRLTTMMNTTATFDVLVYKNVANSGDFELVTTLIGIQSIANTAKENIVDLTLTMNEYGTDFYFIYQPSGFQPLKNNIGCGCSGGAEANLRKFMAINGVYGNNVDSLSTTSNAMGLSLNATVSCDTSIVVCELYNNNQEAALVMAYAARYKAGELVHEYVLKTNQITRYTMSSREFLWGKRNHFKKEYNDRVTWLASIVDMDLIGCFGCSTNNSKIRKSGILV